MIQRSSISISNSSAAQSYVQCGGGIFIIVQFYRFSSVLYTSTAGTTHRRPTATRIIIIILIIIMTVLGDICCILSFAFSVERMTQASTHRTHYPSLARYAIPSVQRQAYTQCYYYYTILVELFCSVLFCLAEYYYESSPPHVTENCALPGRSSSSVQVYACDGEL